MIVLFIIIGVIAFLVIMLLLITFSLYKALFYSPVKNQNNDYKLYDSPQFHGKEEQIIALINDLRKIPYKDIYAISYDKLELHARLLQVKDSHKVAIMFHGYRGTAYRDFSGGAMEMYSLDYNVILVDERAHGESQGHTITFGRRERRDVLTWISKAKSLLGNDVEIVLVGISMGGATVLFSATRTEDKIKIIADCPYASADEVLKSGIISLGLSPTLFYPLVYLSAFIWGRFNLAFMDASKAIKKSNHKVLIFHGDKDSVVNYKFSKRIYLENKDKVRYEQFTDADHGMSYLCDEDRYRNALIEFLSE